MTVFSDPSRMQSDLCVFSEDLISCNDERNVLGLVADLMLTLIGCIVLKIDHVPNTMRYKELLSDSALNILRNDLENLLRFETKDLKSLLLEISRIRSSKKNKDVHNSTLEIPDKEQISCEEGKCLLRRTVLSVMGFLIFRRSRKSFTRTKDSSMDLSCLETASCYSSETVSREVMSMDTYLCENSLEESNNLKDISIIEPIATANDTYTKDSPFGQTYLNDFSFERIFIKCDNHSTLINNWITTEPLHDRVSSKSSSSNATKRRRARKGKCFGSYERIKKMHAAGICKKYSVLLVPLKGKRVLKYETSKKVGNASTISNFESWECEDGDYRKSNDTKHVCSKIYCPLCYGWLWLPIYYSFFLIYPAIIDITYNSLTRYQDLIGFRNFSKY